MLLMKDSKPRRNSADHKSPLNEPLSRLPMHLLSFWSVFSWSHEVPSTSNQSLAIIQSITPSFNRSFLIKGTTLHKAVFFGLFQPKTTIINLSTGGTWQFRRGQLFVPSIVATEWMVLPGREFGHFCCRCQPENASSDAIILLTNALRQLRLSCLASKIFLVLPFSVEDAFKKRVDSSSDRHIWMGPGYKTRLWGE